MTNWVDSEIDNYSINPIRASYLVALILLAVLTLVGHMVWFGSLAQAKDDAKQANLVVGQQKLVERIATISAAMAYTHDSVQVSRLRERLEAALTRLENSNSRLLSAFGPLPLEIAELYFQEPIHMDTALREFIAKARILLTEADQSIPVNDPNLLYLQGNLPVMIDRLERVLEQYQRESERSVDRSIATNTLLDGATLLALLATGLFIFRPMERLILSKHAGELESANRALEASQHELQLQYDNAPDMLLSIDIKTQKVVRCNATTLAKLGYTKDELVGMSRHDLYAPDCGERAAEAFSEFLANGRVDDFELQLICKNGNVIDVSLSAVRYCDRDGRAVYADAIWRDITARKTAERAVTNRDRKLTTLYLLGEQMLLSKALHPLMHNVAYCLYESLDAKSVLICELTPGGDYFTVQAGIGVPRRYIAAEPCCIEPDSLADKAIRSGAPVCLSPGQGSCLLYGVDYLNDEQVSGGIGCMIEGSWGAVGLIMVFIKSSRASCEDIDYIQSLANLLGVAADRIQPEKNITHKKARHAALG